MKKTNVMRILEGHKISYKSYEYELDDKNHSVADLIGVEESRVFKTLVTKSDSDNYVFVIPLNLELDLKKAAKAVNEKNIEMLKQKDLLPLTGYVHGGCSPIGMKKFFTTLFDISAKGYEKIIFNGGKVGRQVELKVEDINKVIEIKFADLTKSKED